MDGNVSSGGAFNKTAIVGANVTLYIVHAGGTRALGTVTSNRSGNFSVSLNLNQEAVVVRDRKIEDGILYAVARRGSEVELMTVIGAAIPKSITINEMTTVAASYAMAQILQKGVIPSEPLLPAQIAAGMAENLVSAATGMPSKLVSTSPNAKETNAWQSLGTLANILAVCVRNSASGCNELFALTTPLGGVMPKTTVQAMVNIARHPSAHVRDLYALGQAAKVFEPNLEARNGPDAPDEFLRLDAFTLALKFNSTGRVDAHGNELCPFGGPGNFVFDTNGYVWITNNVVQGTPDSTNCMVVLKPNGEPADGSNNTPASPLFGGGVLGQGFGLGFDPSGTVWSGNFGWGGVLPTDEEGNPGGRVSRFTAVGQPLSPPTGYVSTLFRVQGTVSDNQGNIWLASYGNSGVQIFPKGDHDTSFPLFQNADTGPFDIRLDSDGSGWVSYTGSSTLSKFTLAQNGLQLQFNVPIGANSSPKGVAVDSHGNAWVAAGAENVIYAVGKYGNQLGRFAGGGIIGPWGAAVDSDDIVWAANFGELQPEVRKYGVSALCGATAGKCPPGLNLGDPISPVTGYTLPSGGDQVRLHNGKPLYDPLPLQSFQPLMRLTAAHPDAAGNLWVTNNWKPGFAIDLVLNPGGDAMVVFVGLAAPVMPVLYSAPPISPFTAR